MTPAAATIERFIPNPDAQERFEITIRAPADLVMEVARGFDMQSLPAVKAVFRLREVLMGARPSTPRRPQGIRDETRSLGWGILAETPGRSVICGATCQPWLADVKFTPVPAAEFAAHVEPDRVKIAWTLEAEAIDRTLTRFAQETRAAATDAESRRKFRRYWRWARFGIVAIRLLLLPAIRREAERRWKARAT